MRLSCPQKFATINSSTHYPTFFSNLHLSPRFQILSSTLINSNCSLGTLELSRDFRSTDQSYRHFHLRRYSGSSNISTPFLVEQPSATAISLKPQLTAPAMCQSQSQYYSASGSFVKHNQPNDTWYCSECGALNLDYVDVCPACGQGTRQTATQYYSTSHVTYGGAGSPAPGVWVCENCGASNSDNTPDFCPICEVSR